MSGFLWSDMARNTLSSVLGAIVLSVIAGCAPPGVMVRPRLSEPRTSDQRHIVFLISSQGSQPEFPGGSQFVDYVLINYDGQADFRPKAMESTGIDPPSEEVLDQIAVDICDAIGYAENGDRERDVGVWAFSLGADSMFEIIQADGEMASGQHRAHSSTPDRPDDPG